MNQETPSVEDYKISEYLNSNASNHALLFLNIYNKHYLCISNFHMQIEDKRDNQHVYIGSHWKDVSFPKTNISPLVVCDNFSEFMNEAKKQEGSVTSFFKKHEESGVKFYIEHKDSMEFVLYGIYQWEQNAGLNEDQLKLVIKKTNERFWIWERIDLNLSFELYNKFKKENKKLLSESRVTNVSDNQLLPVEILLLLYKDNKVQARELFNKLNKVKEYILVSSLQHAVKNALEVIFNDGRVLKSYLGKDIDHSDNVVMLLQSDMLLNKIFIEGVGKSDFPFIKKNHVAISRLFKLIKDYDLGRHDPFSSEEEFEYLSNIFLKEKNSEEELNNLFKSPKYSFSELAYFEENRHKINTTLVNYLSVKLSI